MKSHTRHQSASLSFLLSSSARRTTSLPNASSTVTAAYWWSIQRARSMVQGSARHVDGTSTWVRATADNKKQTNHSHSYLLLVKQSRDIRSLHPNRWCPVGCAASIIFVFTSFLLKFMSISPLMSMPTAICLDMTSTKILALFCCVQNFTSMSTFMFTSLSLSLSLCVHLQFRLRFHLARCTLHMTSFTRHPAPLILHLSLLTFFIWYE